MKKEFIGKTTDGEEIFSYEITNSCGTAASIMNYGGTLLKLLVNDKGGKSVDVVLGFEKIEDYFINVPGFGCNITPVANRIGKAQFTLDGVTYDIDKNDGNNNLHSGFHPLHRKIWDVTDYTESAITFELDSHDLECGFPGNTHIKATYTLNADNSLQIDYVGSTDQDTLFNPTNHSYFNLDGHDSGSILDHTLYLNCDQITYADEESIPNGEIRAVKGTPFDFTLPHAIGDEINADYDLIKFGKGYDHNYIINKNQPAPEYSESGLDVYHYGFYKAAHSGIVMDMYASLPGVQLYTGNFLDGSYIGKGGFAYQFRYGCAFEPQYFPNAVNVASFETPLLKAGEPKHSRILYKFSVE